jgi:hypothetical protein
MNEQRPPIAARAFLDALPPKKTPEQPERESADLRLDAKGGAPCSVTSRCTSATSSFGLPEMVYGCSPNEVSLDEALRGQDYSPMSEGR